MSFSDLFPQLAAPETPRFPADPMFLLRFHQNDGAANVLSGSGTVPSSAPRTVLLPVAKPGTLVEIEVDGDPRVVVRGTPGAGQVGVSAITGAVTFHSSDAGEPFTWELDALHTVATADFLNRLQAEVKAAQDGTVLPAPLASIAGLTTAADQMIYTTAADTYAVTTLTAFARTLLDDADAATARGTLGLGTLAVENAASIGVDLVPSGTRNIGSATNPWNGGVYNGTVFTRYDSALTGTGRLEMVRVGTGSPTAHGLAWARDTQRFGFYTDIAAAVRADFEAKDLIAIGKNIVNPSAALSSASFPIFTAGNDTAAALLGAPVGGYWNHSLARLLLSLNNGSGATCDLGVADLYADEVNIGSDVKLERNGTETLYTKFATFSQPEIFRSSNGTVNLTNTDAGKVIRVFQAQVLFNLPASPPNGTKFTFVAQLDGSNWLRVGLNGNSGRGVGISNASGTQAYSTSSLYGVLEVYFFTNIWIVTNARGSWTVVTP